MLLRWGRLLGTIGRGGSIGQGRMHCCKDSRKSNHGKDKAKQVTSPLTDNSMGDTYPPDAFRFVHCITFASMGTPQM
jgi:hypothetical protein